MHHLFVSYSRRDTHWVSALVQRLERVRPVWFDQRDIPLTLPWVEEVTDAIVESDIFVICDSVASRNSASCATENSIAFENSKRTILVEVGSDLDIAARTVTTALVDLDGRYLRRVELVVLARDWERAGRPRSGLINSRMRRRLAAGSPAPREIGRVEKDFLRASRGQARRRYVATLITALAIAVGILAAWTFTEATDRIDASNDEQAASYTRTRAALRVVAAEPYRGLSEAALRGENEGANDAEVISSALDKPVPDDAFKVPVAADGFAVHLVERQIVVTSGRNRAWGRAANARDVRDARPARAPAESAAARDLRLRQVPHTGAVEVLRGRRLWRRVTFPAAPHHLRLSANGRELAAAVGPTVVIADLELGAVRTTLHGPGGSILDVAWSRNGRRVWALTRGLAVSWPVRDGRVLLDEPSSRFEALLHAEQPSGVWAVSNDGRLRLLDTRTGHQIKTLRVRDEPKSGSGSPDGRIAAISGARGLWIVPLRGGEPRLMRLPGCTPGRPAFQGSGTVYLPCIGGPLLTISVSAGRVTGRAQLAPGGVFAAKVLPRSGTVVAIDTWGHMHSVTPSGQAHELWHPQCGASVVRLAVAADDSTLIPAGEGAGHPGCSQRGRLIGTDPRERSSWRFDSILDSPTRSSLTEAAAVTPTGDAFAFGYSDGTVVLHPAENITPTSTIRNVYGEVRDMLVTTDGELVVATAAGVVQQLPFCARCLSNRALARIARARVDRATAIGAARRVRGG